MIAFAGNFTFNGRTARRLGGFKGIVQKVHDPIADEGFEVSISRMPKRWFGSQYSIRVPNEKDRFVRRILKEHHLKESKNYHYPQ